MSCVFCGISTGAVPASIVFENEDTIAFIDLRQFHSGHVLVIPRRHIVDIRDADEQTAMAVMATVAKVARAVSAVFPSDGLSLWHSAGAGANQEVPHLHVHIHPRFLDDDVLRVYPSAPSLPPREILEEWAVQLRGAL